MHLYQDGGALAGGGRGGKGGSGGSGGGGMDGGLPDGRCSGFGSLVPFTTDMVQMVIALDRSQGMDQPFGSDTQLNTALYALNGEVSAYTQNRGGDHLTISFSFLDFPDATSGCSAQTGCCASDAIRTSTVTSFETAAYYCQMSTANCGSRSHQPLAAALQKADQAISTAGVQSSQRYVLLVTDGLQGSPTGGGCSSSFNDCTSAIDAMQALASDARVAIVGFGESEPDWLPHGRRQRGRPGGALLQGHQLLRADGRPQPDHVGCGLQRDPDAAGAFSKRPAGDRGGQPIAVDGMNGWTYESNGGRLHLHGSACQSFVQFGWNALQITTTSACGGGHSGSGGFAP